MVTRWLVVSLRGHHSHAPPRRSHIPTRHRLAEGQEPIVFLAGVHIGCFELFGTERVRAIRDLKGKTVAVFELGSGAHVFIARMAAHVGLDPRRDINWIERPSTEAMQLLAEGNIDAYLGFPPEPQELRAKQIGHVVVNSMMDRPWSQYFCCMAAGHRAGIEKHPVAGEILALAKLFAPSDPEGLGMVKVRQALGLLTETVQRKRAAA